MSTPTPSPLAPDPTADWPLIVDDIRVIPRMIEPLTDLDGLLRSTITDAANSYAAQIAPVDSLRSDLTVGQVVSALYELRAARAEIADLLEQMDAAQEWASVLADSEQENADRLMAEGASDV